MIRFFFRFIVKNRWFAIGPALVFAAYNIYLVAGPLNIEPPRTPEVVERVSGLDDIDMEAESEKAASELGSRPLVLQFGADIAHAVQERLTLHLGRASTEAVTVADADDPVDAIDPEALILSFGDTTATRALITPKELADLGDEGYLLRSGTVGDADVIAVDGSATSRKDVADVGALHGAYAMLEELGFGFLHPLEPTPPLAIPGDAPELDHATAPRWPVRGLHLHTMHPIELTNLLQGWGPEGPDDLAGWEAMLPEWDQFLEWMLANGQNKVQWVWLAAPSWMEYADSDERIQRIKRVVDRAHDFGIEVGLNVPIRLQQQNSGRLVRTDGALEDEIVQIEEGVAHVMKAGFDYLTTEQGKSEFTDVPGQRMIDWLNAFAATAEDDYDAPVYVKVHASTGQYSENFTDSVTGDPLNFNFVPKFADSRVGVMPHTVQHYSLSDPAPTYGNDDFGQIRQFLNRQAGSRPTVWYPETAYWVSFDNDVPLFLPVYASRRVHDLRLLASDEDAGRMGRGEHAGASMDGQLTFSSGWEWGYWIQEVVTARAAWDPHTELETDSEALVALLEPLERVFGDAGAPLVDWLVEYIEVQQNLLIDGRLDGEIPDDIVRRNGQAYLQGWETWDDVSHSIADRFDVEKGRMQPARTSLIDMRKRGFERSLYTDEIAPLQAAMDERFNELVDELEVLRDDVPANARGLFEEIVDSAMMTANRARQVRGLYGYVDADVHDAPAGVAQAHLEDARAAVDRALNVVVHREEHYRVPAERIASWSANPTVYPYTYLWTVRSLFYWQRDEAQAVRGSRNPCLFNIIDPITVVEGDGLLSTWVSRLADVADWLPASSGYAQCMQAPSEEPDFLPVDWQSLR